VLTAAIIQARMGSTRLPGKVMMEIAGRPMLAHVIERARAAEGVGAVCVATTELARDDVLADLAKGLGAKVFRGDEEDVLARYGGAARALGADLVIRITSDCPLLDPALLSEMLARRAAIEATTGPVDYYSNTLVRTYPRGLDAEILPREVLARAAAEATDARAREHVTWHVYRHPEEYRCENHAQPDGRDDSAHRFTVDTAEDLELVRRIFASLGGDRPFGFREAVALVEKHPDWSTLNAAVRQKEV
jgi:spore coat polysaccharide biosynthesis protein SpsF